MLSLRRMSILKLKAILFRYTETLRSAKKNSNQNFLPQESCFGAVVGINPPALLTKRNQRLYIWLSHLMFLLSAGSTNFVLLSSSSSLT